LGQQFTWFRCSVHLKWARTPAAGTRCDHESTIRHLRRGAPDVEVRVMGRLPPCAYVRFTSIRDISLAHGPVSGLGRNRSNRLGADPKGVAPPDQARQASLTIVLIRKILRNSEQRGSMFLWISIHRNQADHETAFRKGAQIASRALWLQPETRVKMEKVFIFSLVTL
jgi:hypothetical protein